MTVQDSYRLLDKARRYRPIVLPAAEPGHWWVQSETDAGSFHRVNGTCDCTAGSFGKPCSHRVAVGAILKGIIDYGTWEFTDAARPPSA